MEEGRDLLRRTEGFTTKASRYALVKEMEKAQRILAGEVQTAFSHNREFLSPDECDPAAFCMEHYTCAPGWMTEGQQAQVYGLRPALAWFREQDVRRDAASGFSHVLKSLNQRMEEFLEWEGGVSSKGEKQLLIQVWEKAKKAAGSTGEERL